MDVDGLIERPDHHIRFGTIMRRAKRATGGSDEAFAITILLWTDNFGRVRSGGNVAGAPRPTPAQYAPVVLLLKRAAA